VSRASHVDPLHIPADQLGAGSGVRVEVVADAAALTAHFADHLIAEFREALARGRRFAVFIVPVGPVGQFERFAQQCNAMRIGLFR
jgi:hypothetical protein